MPTRYLVHVVDPDTRQRSTKVIEADSAKAAEAIAARIGVEVLGSELQETPPEAAAKAPPAQPDQDETQWEGSPSQWANSGWYLLCLLVIFIPYAVYRALAIANTRYTLTDQRLRTSWGILSTRMEEVELYRVNDSAVEQSFIQRLLGYGDLVVESSDERTPLLRLEAVRNPWDVREKLRTLAEARRRWRKVTEIEVS